MSLEEQQQPEANTLPDKQRFVLDTVAGLQTFHDFLVSEEGQIDALDPALTIEDLALPEHVADSLRQLRKEYADLVRLTKEELQTDEETLSDTSVESIAQQYQIYIQADERFSQAYRQYSAAPENQLPGTNAIPVDTQSEVESAPSAAETRVTNIPVPPKEMRAERLSEAAAEDVTAQQEAIKQQYADILAAYETVQSAVPLDQQSPDTQQLCQELSDLQTRATIIQRKVTENDELQPVPSADDLKNYTRSMERIQEKVEVLVANIQTENEQVGYASSEDSEDSEDSEESEKLVQSQEAKQVVDPVVPRAPEATDEIATEVTEAGQEAESQTIFGMDLPKAGPDGVVGARSFRDGLEIIKRNHPNIKDNATNTALADSIARTLFVVPPSGLSEEQTTQVAGLAAELRAATDQSSTEQAIAPAEEPSTPEQALDRYVDVSPAAEVHTSSAEESKESDEPVKKRGAMSVEADSPDSESIKIMFADRRDAQSASNAVLSNESVVQAIDDLTHSQTGSGVVAQMEQRDSINNSIPSQAVRDSVQREAASEESLTGLYLADNPQYQAFFQERNISPAAFEKRLQNTIKSIDRKEIDFWEAKFDEPYNSAFGFVQDMTAPDIADFRALPLAERKAYLRADHIKYEAYLAWMDMYELISETVATTPDAPFAELFATWMVEAELQDVYTNTQAA